MEVRNRFKIDRVPDELWTEVHDIVQETGSKIIPKKKKCKKAKWLSEEALQIAEKRRKRNTCQEYLPLGPGNGCSHGTKDSWGKVCRLRKPTTTTKRMPGSSGRI